MKIIRAELQKQLRKQGNEIANECLANGRDGREGVAAEFYDEVDGQPKPKLDDNGRPLWEQDYKQTAMHNMWTRLVRIFGREKLDVERFIAWYASSETKWQDGIRELNSCYGAAISDNSTVDTVGDEVPDERNAMLQGFSATEIGVGPRRNWLGYNWPVRNEKIQIPLADGKFTDYMSDHHMAMIAMTVYNQLREQGTIKDDTNKKQEVAKIFLQLCTQRNMIVASGGNKNVPFYFNFRIIVKLASEIDLDTNCGLKTRTYGRNELTCAAFPVLNEEGKPEMHVSHEIRCTKKNQGLYGVAIFNDEKGRFYQHALKSITTRDKAHQFDVGLKPDESSKMTDERDEQDEKREQEDTDAGAAEQQNTQPKAAMLPLPFKGCTTALSWFMYLNHTWYMDQVRDVRPTGVLTKGPSTGAAAVRSLRGDPGGAQRGGAASSEQKTGEMLEEMEPPEVFVNTFKPQKEPMRYHEGTKMPKTGWGLSGVGTGTVTMDETVTYDGDPTAILAKIRDGTFSLPLPVVLEAFNGQLALIEAVFAEMTHVTSGVGMQTIFDGSACQNSKDPVHAALIADQKEKATKLKISEPGYEQYLLHLSAAELAEAAAGTASEIESAQVSVAPGGNAVESAAASGTQASEGSLIDKLAKLSIASQLNPQLEALLTLKPQFNLLADDKVEMTDQNPLCFTVRLHDGKDDGNGEAIKPDKIDISGMIGQNPSIVYQVEAGQLIKVTFKNTIPAGTLPTELKMSNQVSFTPVYITQAGEEEPEEMVDCVVGEEYELPYPLQKDAGEDADAWKLCFKHGGTIKLVFQLQEVKNPLTSVLKQMQDDFKKSAAAQNAMEHEECESAAAQNAMEHEECESAAAQNAMEHEECGGEYELV